jgi:phosphinothricin acetyltransferase
MPIRASRPDDLPAVRAIYAHYVTNSISTFEVEPPSLAEMARRREALLAAGYPFLIAEVDGAVAGYAYAGPYRERAAYRYTVSDSVYLAADRVGRGLGRALVSELIAICEATGFRQMVAIIGDGGNLCSIRLHERLGFDRVGLLPAVGFKAGRWHDSVLMQRPLGPGSGTLPTTP